MRVKLIRFGVSAAEVEGKALLIKYLNLTDTD